MRRFLRITCAALTLALALAAAAPALPVRERPVPAVPAAWLDTLKAWLQALPTPGLSPAWEKAGSIMDPDGHPTGARPASGTDAGGIMDPDG